MDGLIVVPRHRGAVLRIDGDGLAVAERSVAPRVVRVREEGTVPGRPVIHVSRVLVASGRILQAEAAGDRSRLERNGSVEESVARAGRRVQVVVGEQRAAIARVEDSDPVDRTFLSTGPHGVNAPGEVGPAL